MRKKHRAPLTPEQQRIVVANMPLAWMAARKYVRNMPPGWELEDMVQVGAMALGRAAQEYDPNRGFTFSTFAMRIILHAMNSVLHLSKCDRRDERRVGHTSLSTKLKDGDEFGSLIADTRFEAPGDIAIRNDLIQRAIGKLRPMWRRAVELYFLENLTFRETAERMGVSRSRVEQIINLSLAQMRDERRLQKIERTVLVKEKNPPKRYVPPKPVEEPTVRVPNARGVVDIEEEWLYPTLSILAAEIGITPGTICIALKAGRAIRGRKYRYATAEEMDAYWRMRRIELAMSKVA